MRRIKSSDVKVGEVYVDGEGGAIRILSNHKYEYWLNGQLQDTYNMPTAIAEWHESWRLSEVDTVKRILSNYEV
jgi:hypothetical protein